MSPDVHFLGRGRESVSPNRRLSQNCVLIVFLEEKKFAFFIYVKKIETNIYRVMNFLGRKKGSFYLFKQLTLGPPALNFTPHLNGVGRQCRFWVVSSRETVVTHWLQSFFLENSSA